MNWREKFDAAIQARNNQDYALAEELLLSTDEQDRNYPEFYAVLGHMQWNQHKLEPALNSFQQGMEMRPNSELFSIVIFHCFLKLNQVDNAFDEMRRFMTNHKPNRKSSQYKTLLEGLFEVIPSTHDLLQDIEECRKAYKEACEEYPDIPT